MSRFKVKIYVLTAVLVLQTVCSDPTTPGADTVLRAGAVYTLDDERSWAEAIAISNGEIIFVGSDIACIV